MADQPASHHVQGARQQGQTAGEPGQLALIEGGRIRAEQIGDVTKLGDAKVTIVRRPSGEVAERQYSSAPRLLPGRVRIRSRSGN